MKADSIQLRTKMADYERQIKALSANNKALEKENVRLAESRERAVKARKPAQIKPAKRVSLKRQEVRFMIPDTHGCMIDPVVAAVYIADIKMLDPDVIILLGDHVDCGGFLDEKHTLGYVAQTDYTYEEDLAAANHFLDAVQKAAPRARYHYLEGNHEYRVERQCVKWAKQNRRDAEAMRQREPPEFLLNLKDRGIRYYRQSVCYDGVKVPGTLKLTKCHYSHGWRTGKSAPLQMAQDVGGNIVYGHKHTAGYATATSVVGGEWAAFCPGCGCKKQPLYQHSRPTDWNHGDAVQILSAQGNFIHINNPIINGQSMLGPLMNQKA